MRFATYLKKKRGKGRRTGHFVEKCKRPLFREAFSFCKGKEKKEKEKSIALDPIRTISGKELEFSALFKNYQPKKGKGGKSTIINR